MSNRLRKHSVEILAQEYIGFLKKTNNFRKERVFIDKIAKMIGAVLESPCCNNDNNVVFLTYKKNHWVNSFKALLLKVDVKKWKNSLLRAKTLLSDTLSNPCCS